MASRFPPTQSWVTSLDISLHLYCIEFLKCFKICVTWWKWEHQQKQRFHFSVPDCDSPIKVSEQPVTDPLRNAISVHLNPSSLLPSAGFNFRELYVDWLIWFKSAANALKLLQLIRVKVGDFSFSLNQSGFSRTACLTALPSVVFKLRHSDCGYSDALTEADRGCLLGWRRLVG